MPTLPRIIAFVEYRRAVREAHERVERINDSLRAQLESWRMRPVVEALMSLRGIDCRRRDHARGRTRGSAPLHAIRAS